jgi:hypothetical protein
MRVGRCLMGLCTVGLLFGGCIPEEEDMRLPIPYRAQERYNYCVPACVQMWRLYDGLTSVSQTSIFNWMGGAGCTNQINTEAAINHFTNTKDVYWDNGTSTSYKEMVARQITAFDRQYPTMAVVDGDHTVLITGGKYHVEGNYKIWDYTLVHDPNPYYGAHTQWTAGQWLRLFCGSGQVYCDQFVSSAGVQGWYWNMQAHEDGIRAYGWDQDLGGPREN